jgi:hypothetical protein
MDESPVGGESVVAVTPVEGKAVLNYGFTRTLAHAMGVFFDCKSYHGTRIRSQEYVFYGIANNTASAAMAFEICYNLIIN